MWRITLLTQEVLLREPLAEAHVGGEAVDVVLVPLPQYSLLEGRKHLHQRHLVPATGTEASVQQVGASVRRLVWFTTLISSHARTHTATILTLQASGKVAPPIPS